jgi:hypothetical protein
MAVLIIPKLQLVSNIVHITDFCSRMISRGREAHRLTDGSSEEYVVLESAAQDLSFSLRLYNALKHLLVMIGC